MTGQTQNFSSRYLGFNSIGPLVSIDPSKSTGTEKVATLIGIISWSAGCADLEYPDVYARVADVLPWITEKTGINILRIQFFYNKTL